MCLNDRSRFQSNEKRASGRSVCRSALKRRSGSALLAKERFQWAMPNSQSRSRNRQGDMVSEEHRKGQTRRRLCRESPRLQTYAWRQRPQPFLGLQPARRGYKPRRLGSHQAPSASRVTPNLAFYAFLLFAFIILHHAFQASSLPYTLLPMSGSRTPHIDQDYCVRSRTENASIRQQGPAQLQSSSDRLRVATCSHGNLRPEHRAGNDRHWMRQVMLAPLALPRLRRI